MKFGSTARDFAKYYVKHVKVCCILREQRPLSRMYHRGGRNCLKEILFTRTLL